MSEDKSLEEKTAEALEEAETEEIEETETEEVTAEKIKLGEREYTTEELDELVGLGNKAREFGEHHGGFDKVVEEFGRKSQKIGELNKRLEDLESSKTATQESKEQDGDDLEAAREAARKLGIVLKDDLDSYYQDRRSAEKLLETSQNLEGELDGSDGRPKFETKAVLEFMAENPGFKDPKRAYEAMNLDEIANWKAEKLAKGKKGITTATETSGDKRPAEVKANRENLRDLIAEQFN